MPDTPSASTPGAPTRAWLDVPTAPTGPTPTGAAPTPAWSDAPSGLAYPAYTPPATPDEPLLPASYNENELRAAVGATPRAEAAPTHRAPTDDGDDDDDIGARRGSRKTVLVGATTLIIGLAIAGIVILGRVNSDRYVLTCDAERAVPEQGRSFPPWGTHAMSGDQWKPIKLPPEADCRRQEPASETALESVYLAMLVDRATALLATKPPADPDAAKIDEAEAVLKQALLLARVPEGAASEVVDERHKSKSEIERMLGDVTYWRAAAKLHEAANALGEAAKQFDAAAAQKSHVSDAAGRAAYTRKLVDELNGTPNAGVTPPPMPATPEHEAAPVGTALPIEPQGSAAGPPLPTPDAGVPSGGVLL